MKLTRTQRLIQIVQLLQAGRPCGMEWLASELGVSRRTIFRDMKVLKEAGIGCDYDAARESYRIEHSYYLKPLNFSLQEALVLMLLTRKLVDERVIPLFASAASAGLKIESSLPADIRAHCGELLDGVEVGRLVVSDVDPVTDVLLRIQEAIASRRKIRVVYDSYFEQAEIATVLHPYRLTFRSRGWYVVGHSQMHREVRTFKLERFIDLQVQEVPFKLPRGFDLDAYFGNAWNMIRGDRTYHVEIHFDKKVAGNVEEVAWHPTQRTRRRADGSLVFEVDVDGIEEIAWWVLGYGDQAVVSEPQGLRQLVASHARNLVRRYQTEGAAVGA